MPGQARPALRDGRPSPVVPLAALARAQSAGARVGRACPAGGRYLSADTTVRICPGAAIRTFEEKMMSWAPMIAKRPEYSLLDRLERQRSRVGSHPGGWM